MSVSPATQSVNLNFGWQGVSKALRSVSLKVDEESNYKVYLTGATSEEIKPLYLIQLSKMAPLSSLSLSIDQLRSLKLKTRSDQKNPLEIEWPKQVRAGQTYSLIVKSESNSWKAAIVEDGIRAETTPAFTEEDIRDMRNAHCKIFEILILPLMETLEVEFLNQIGGTIVPGLGENLRAKASIAQTIAELTPQELEGMLNPIISLHLGKKGADEAKKLAAAEHQIKICINFLGDDRLKKTMRSFLSHHSKSSSIMDRMEDKFVSYCKDKAMSCRAPYLVKLFANI